MTSNVDRAQVDDLRKAKRTAAVLVSGHTLQFEGAAHKDNGVLAGGRGVAGRAQCSCGAMSDALPSSTQRKRWHRQHKLDVLAEATPMTDPCGGNTKGGDGCRCDPPFGGTMSETKARPDFRVRRSPEGWYVDQWGTGWEQVSGPHGARGVAVKSTRPAGAFCEKHWSWLCGKPCEVTQ